MKFNPRAIPGRAHYDRLTTWTTGVFSRMSGDDLAEFQKMLTQRAKEALDIGDDDIEMVAAVLAEIGFCAVIDSMVDTIESEGSEKR